MLTRRTLVGGLAAVPALASGLSFAAAATDRRLVVIVLRGALDGLAAVPPWRDPDYEAVRGALALEPPGGGDGVLDLDGYFSLHPSLKTLHRLYGRKELAVVHAAATPYRDRSHFDAQDLLENGSTRPRGLTSGWLNRALAELPGAGKLGLAVSQQVPLLLRGEVAVASWAPAVLREAPPDFMARVAALWQADPVLGPALQEGLRAQAMSDDVLGGGMAAPGAAQLAALGEPAGRLLAAPDGARVAVIEAGGWDTHAQQGKLTGRLATALDNLDGAIEGLQRGLGDAWAKTAVLAVTEFGRTAAPNGTGGTDHGTASCAFLFGGAVRGGRVLADWPGLAHRHLYEGRDLKPTVDLRRIAKGVLRDHMQIEPAALDRSVFPDSRTAAPVDGLIAG